MEETKGLGKELKKEIKLKNPRMVKKRLEFVYEYINNGGNATAAWMVVYPEYSYHSATTAASFALKHIDLSDILLFMGINLDSMKEAMENLKTKQPAEYMKYYCKLHKLDDNRIELSGEIKMPIINIIAQAEDE